MSPERASLAGWRPSPRRWLLAALLVLLLAAAFRLVALPNVPPGLAQDEILDADIALFIRRGEHALFFGHGYGHEPLYHYLATPFAPLLGDNWLAIRLPSAYLGLLLVALTLRWARSGFGATAALVAGLGLAVSWWPVIFSRIGIRPVLEPVLLVAAALCWPLGRETIARRGLLRAGLAGLLLGLAMYSYTAARVAPLLPVLVALLMAAAAGLARRRGETAADAARAQVTYAAVVLVVCGLVYLPLGLTLRAHPELQQRLEQLEGPLDALRAGDAGPVARATLATLGVFSLRGDPRWTYSPPGRPLFDPLTALLFYGGLLLALWRWRRPGYALALVWLAVALLPSSFSPDAPSTVRLIGALPVVYLLPGLAVDQIAVWAAMTRRRGGRTAAWALAMLMAALLLFNGARTVRDGFVRWPAELETRLRYQTALRDIGRAWATGDGGAPVVAEVFFEPIDADSLRRVIGRDPAARWVQTGG
ncbi:MAG TPA: glycosyltransferase family 39 protein, partial [Promineifilum sp.]|nr:glycosyltransferase family 39 protein [Promineifilum sp.]